MGEVRPQFSWVKGGKRKGVGLIVEREVGSKGAKK